MGIRFVLSIVSNSKRRFPAPRCRQDLAAFQPSDWHPCGACCTNGWEFDLLFATVRSPHNTKQSRYMCIIYLDVFLQLTNHHRLIWVRVLVVFAARFWLNTCHILLWQRIPGGRTKRRVSGSQTMKEQTKQSREILLELQKKSNFILKKRYRKNLRKLFQTRASARMTVLYRTRHSWGLLETVTTCLRIYLN